MMVMKREAAILLQFNEINWTIVQNYESNSNPEMRVKYEKSKCLIKTKVL